MKWDHYRISWDGEEKCIGSETWGTSASRDWENRGKTSKKAAASETEGESRIWCYGSQVRKVIEEGGSKPRVSVMLVGGGRWGLRTDCPIQHYVVVGDLGKSGFDGMWLQKSDWVCSRENKRKNSQRGGRNILRHFAMKGGSETASNGQVQRHLSFLSLFVIFEVGYSWGKWFYTITQCTQW